jgi:hypothetical protein
MASNKPDFFHPSVVQAVTAPQYSSRLPAYRSAYLTRHHPYAGRRPARYANLKVCLEYTPISPHVENGPEDSRCSGGERQFNRVHGEPSICTFCHRFPIHSQTHTPGDDPISILEPFFGPNNNLTARQTAETSSKSIVVIIDERRTWSTLIWVRYLYMCSQSES